MPDPHPRISEKSHKEALFNLGLLHERHYHDDAKASEYFQKFREVAPDAAQAGDVKDWLRSYQLAKASKGDGDAPAASRRSGFGVPDVSADVPSAPKAPGLPGMDDAPGVPSLDESVPDVAPSGRGAGMAFGGAATPRRERPPPRPRVSPDAPLSVYTFQGLIDAEDYDTVIQRFGSEVSKTDPDYGRYCYLAGVAQLEKKNGAAALELLNDAVRRFPEEPEYQLQLGWAHHFQGDADTARKVWEDGRMRFPDKRDEFQQALDVLP